MKLLSTAAAFALVAAPALAGGLSDPVVEAPVAVPTPAPVYVAPDWTGAYAGGQIGLGTVTAEGGNFDEDGDGFLAGLHAGYNHDFGQFVLGGEIDIDLGELSIGDGDDKIDQVARLKLRAGYDLGRTMVYATAGGAAANAEIGGTEYSDTGAFAGLGVSHRINDNYVAGGEVLFHQFDDFDDTGIDVDATTASARVSFQF